MELLALLSLVFSARGLFFAYQILTSMCELAFGPVPAVVLLDPVLAHLCLVLSLVYLGYD
jgi:hypothetical protein